MIMPHSFETRLRSTEGRAYPLAAWSPAATERNGGYRGLLHGLVPRRPQTVGPVRLLQRRHRDHRRPNPMPDSDKSASAVL